MTERRTRVTEIALVLGVSLGASAIYSLLQLLETVLSPAGIAGNSTALNQSMSAHEYFDLAYQLVGIALALVPAWLAIYFMQQRSEFAIGLWPIRSSDVLRSFALAAVIGIPGIALYAAARSVGFAVEISAAPAAHHWWNIPVLLLSAIRSGVVEEVIMIAFLFRQFEKLQWTFAKGNLISAGIRACYHAYQGLGGVVGNFILGLIFGWCYKRWGRVAPLVTAHFVMDAVVFAGFALLSKQLAQLGW